MAEQLRGYPAEEASLDLQHRLAFVGNRLGQRGRHRRRLLLLLPQAGPLHRHNIILRRQFNPPTSQTTDRKPKFRKNKLWRSRTSTERISDSRKCASVSSSSPAPASSPISLEEDIAGTLETSRRQPGDERAKQASALGRRRS